jgi:hypothetical protein
MKIGSFSHQERKREHFGVTMAKPLWSDAHEIGRKNVKERN